MVRYFGVLSSHASRRREVVPSPPPPRDGQQLTLLEPGDDAAKPTRKPWAWLLRHVFQVDMDTCPSCGGRMHFVEAATTKEAIAELLARQGLGPRPPPRAPPPPHRPGSWRSSSRRRREPGSVGPRCWTPRASSLERRSMRRYARAFEMSSVETRVESPLAIGVPQRRRGAGVQAAFTRWGPTRGADGARIRRWLFLSAPVAGPVSIGERKDVQGRHGTAVCSVEQPHWASGGQGHEPAGQRTVGYTAEVGIP